MISKTSKRISALLAVLMLAQFIPSNLIGQLAAKVQAEDVEDYDTYTDYEDERLIDDYTYEIPYESENSVEVEIPPTYIYEDENDTEDIQESETDSESGETETEFDYPLPELSEEDERLIGIISEFESYSMLSETDAEFLCSHTGISDADFQYMEEHGTKLSLSINYGKLAGLYLCPVSSITELSPDEDQYSELIIKIHEYTSQINSDFTGSETDIELRAYLLRGYTCDEVFCFTD